MTKKETPKQMRGFAVMKAKDPERLKDVSARAGRVSQKKGKGYRWTREQAKAMAPKGARAKHKVEKIKL